MRHWLARHDFKLSLWHLAVGGALIGYITGIVVSTGPLSVPLFLFYGLSKARFSPPKLQVRSAFTSANR